MKSVSEVLLQRRSIRRYERESIPEETMQFVYDAIRNTSTSYNGQQFSVIDIDSQETKEALSYHMLDYLKAQGFSPDK